MANTLTPPRFSFSRWTSLVQFAIGAGLLIAVWQFANGGEALALLTAANSWWLIGAIGMVNLQVIISAIRWHLTAHQLGQKFSHATAIREYYLAQLTNQVLPGGVLGDAHRVVRTRYSGGLLVSGQAVVTERVLGQAALIVVMLTAFLAHHATPEPPPWPNWFVVAVMGATIGVLALAVLVGFGSQLLPTPLAQPIRHSIATVGRTLRRPGILVTQIVLSLTTAVVNVLAFAMCAWAIGAPLSIGTAFAVVPVILFTMVVPVTVSGWGLREGAAAAIFPLVALGSAEGLATSVAFGLVVLTASLPGLAGLRRPPATMTS